jgi:hypothetical protein
VESATTANFPLCFSELYPGPLRPNTGTAYAYAAGCPILGTRLHMLFLPVRTERVASIVQSVHLSIRARLSYLHHVVMSSRIFFPF